MKRTMLSIQAIPDTDGIRTAELYGQDHTVIPCVALVEGVLWPVNAPSPELALAEEFGRFPDSWNGRPVVFKHPVVDGVAVSASSPELLENNAFGLTFNTVVEDGKLKIEIWINQARVEELGQEAQDTIAALTSGDTVVEVSTGLFTQREPVTGEFEGETYEAIWRNIVPDHLAVLPEGSIGACSVADGCGAPRSNEMQPAMRAMEFTSSSCTCEPTGAGGGGDEGDEHQSMWARLQAKFGDLMQFRDSSEHLSDHDLRVALNLALTAADPDSFFFILAVYPEANDTGTFVYEQGFSGTLFERDFSVAEGGPITLGAEATSVRPVTTFVPVEVITGNAANINQENDMDVKELVNALIANEGSQFGEDDREWLMGLEAEQLTKMSPVEPAAPAAQTPEQIAAAEQAEAEADRLQAIADARAPVTTEQYIADAPAEIQQLLNASLDMHRQRKNAVIESLMANDRNLFTKPALEAKSLEELEQIAVLATDITYIGQGPVISNTVDDNRVGEMPSVFDLTPRQADAA